MPNLPELGPQQKGTVIYVSRREDAEFNVRFTIPPHGYYFNVNWDENGRFLKNGTGIMYHVFSVFVTYMRLNYSIQIPHEHTTGTYVSSTGQWTGSLSSLQVKEVDVAIGPFIPTEERIKDFQITTPFIWDASRIAAGQSFTVSVNMFGYVRIFTWQTWALICCSAIFMALLSTSFEKMLRPYFADHPTLFRRKVNKTFGNLFGRYLFNYCANIVMMGTDEKWLPGTYSLRILLTVWLIAILIILQVFNAKIRATLLIKTEPPRVENAATVIARQLVPFMWRGSAYPFIFRSSKDPYLMEIERLSVLLKSQYFDSELFLPPRLIDVLAGRAVIIADTVTLTSGIIQNCMDVPPAQRTGFYYIGREPCSHHYLGLMMQQDIHPRLRKAINYKIRQMLDSGLVYMWRERSLQSLDTCSRRDESQDNNARPLDLQDVQGLFYMLILLLSFDLLLLLAELAVSLLCFCIRKKAIAVPCLENVLPDFIFKTKNNNDRFHKIVFVKRHYT
ncbi:glutamate receptor ionotropic, kainate 2-like [Varroa jacobsoni]|uniref:glutamate receptor ionotropic, kainate 2-like n=1 Tax=Varroa jacobsoni TaxID=62625 RepID=UPI000BF26389|nr:glutamate receptor ionotropic, kainate 2-like [Varroa jacobsoni]